MTDLKKIGARLLLQRLAGVLGIEGVSQRAPTLFDTSRLVPVVALDPGMAGVQDFQLLGNLTSIAGLSSFNWMPLGPDAAAFTLAGFGAGSFDIRADLEHVILGMRVTINYDAAGRNADEAAQAALNLNVLRQTAASSISLVSESYLATWAIINGSVLNYIWAHPWWIGQSYLGVDPSPGQPQFVPLTMNPVYVPAGARYMLSVGRTVGNWPANTTANVELYGVTCPKGMRPPGI